MQRRSNCFKILNARDFFSKRPYRMNLELRSVTLNVSVKPRASDGGVLLLKSILALESIAQQKVVLRRAKKPLSSVQLQKGTVTGVAVCLRGAKAYTLMEKFASTMLPVLSNADIGSQMSFDKRGNITFQFKSLLSFPEIEEEYYHFQPGKGAKGQSYLPLSISLATNCKNKSEGALLLSSWYIPTFFSE